jgi:hypothetical protein
VNEAAANKIEFDSNPCVDALDRGAAEESLETFSFVCSLLLRQAQGEEPMIRIAFVGAIATAALMTSPLLVGPTASGAQDLKLAQADVQGEQYRDRQYRDRQYRERGERRQKSEREGTVGIGPGMRAGPRRECRTVIKSVRRGDRTITKKERRCD